jgi:hypothetical protein
MVSFCDFKEDFEGVENLPEVFASLSSLNKSSLDTFSSESIDVGYWMRKLPERVLDCCFDVASGSTVYCDL